MLVRLRTVVAGKRMTIAAVVRDGRCPLEKFIEDIRFSNPHAIRKIMAILELAAREGLEALDKTKFNPLGEGLFEFKEHNAGIRLFCYFDEHRKRWVIVHKPWIKAGKDKQQQKAITDARNEMAELKKCGFIAVEEEGRLP